MASQRDQRAEDARFRVMRLLSEKPKMSTRQIAEKIGVSNGYAYYILIALIEKGFIKLENFKISKRKKQYAYLLTPKGIREKRALTVSFIKRKREEFEKLRKEIDALENEVQLEHNSDVI